VFLGVLDNMDTTEDMSFLISEALAKVLGGGNISCMVRTQFIHDYNNIISLENLLLAWKEFRLGKKSKKDVLLFDRTLMSNLIALNQKLYKEEYRHSIYEAFTVNDPKSRNIHKAIVEDRLLHHAIYRTLYPFFDRTFISDSYSCRDNKGTHKAILRFKSFIQKVGKNNTKTVWVLKCDIRKFFASIDHCVLKLILEKYIKDKKILNLLYIVIDSFSTNEDGLIGLPLGNLTSQLLVNIYMNKFDQFVKHKLKVKYYIRYADDFVVLSRDKQYLESLILEFDCFLKNSLKLSLHPDKVYIKTLNSGVDFLGWVHFPKYRVLRTVTKRRMFRSLSRTNNPSIKASYLGMLSHGNSYKLSKIVERL
jgi:retron-type reverse transcriptase